MSVIIRLQNLPLTASSIDIRRFFLNLSIPDGGVHIVGGRDGDAFIAFSTDEDARQAMNLSGNNLQDLPVRLLLSSRNEMFKVIEQARQKALGILPSENSANSSNAGPGPPSGNVAQAHGNNNSQMVNESPMSNLSNPSSMGMAPNVHGGGGGHGGGGMGMGMGMNMTGYPGLALNSPFNLQQAQHQQMNQQLPPLHHHQTHSQQQQHHNHMHPQQQQQQQQQMNQQMNPLLMHNPNANAVAMAMPHFTGAAGSGPGPMFNQVHGQAHAQAQAQAQLLRGGATPNPFMFPPPQNSPQMPPMMQHLSQLGLGGNMTAGSQQMNPFSNPGQHYGGGSGPGSSIPKAPPPFNSGRDRERDNNFRPNNDNNNGARVRSRFNQPEEEPQPQLQPQAQTQAQARGGGRDREGRDGDRVPERAAFPRGGGAAVGKADRDREGGGGGRSVAFERSDRGGGGPRGDRGRGGGGARGVGAAAAGNNRGPDKERVERGSGSGRENNSASTVKDKDKERRKSRSRSRDRTKRRRSASRERTEPRKRRSRSRSRGDRSGGRTGETDKEPKRSSSGRVGSKRRNSSKEKDKDRDKERSKFDSSPKKGGGGGNRSDPDEGCLIIDTSATDGHVSGSGGGGRNSTTTDPKPYAHAHARKSDRDRGQKSSSSSRFEREPHAHNTDSDPKSLLDLNVSLDFDSSAVLLRHVPASMSERDVCDFFSDIGLTPVAVRVLFDGQGLQNGNVICEFPDANKARRATTKDGMCFGRSTIAVSLLPRSSPPNNARTTSFRGGGGGRGGMRGGGGGFGGPRPRFPTPESENPFVQAMQAVAAVNEPRHRLRNPVNRGGGTRIGRPALSTAAPSARVSESNTITNSTAVISQEEAQDLGYFERPGCVVAVTNIPYSATMDDILKYLEESLQVPVSRDRIIRRFNEFKQPTGDARIAFDSQFEAKEAHKLLSGTTLWNRTIQVSIPRQFT